MKKIKTFIRKLKYLNYIKKKEYLMNNYPIYSIYDKIAGVYAQPFLSQNDATAQRQFNYQMQNSAMVAGDCALYKIGDFNLSTGQILPCVEFICNYVGGEDNV